jgi:hypothetical protein
MPEFSQLSNIYLFLVLFFPGFISLKIYDLLMPNEKRNFSQDFLDAVSYSILNLGMLLALLAVPTIYFEWYDKPWIFFILFFFALLVFPTIWPVLIFKIRTECKYFKWLPSPIRRTWDWVFLREKASWVIVHLKDGRKIGGVFAENSHAASLPAKEQIYLEELWQLSELGEFECLVKNSRGVIIFGDEILLIEFFDNNKIRS